jgi:hypothetical protein
MLTCHMTSSTAVSIQNDVIFVTSTFLYVSKKSQNSSNDCPLVEGHFFWEKRSKMLILLVTGLVTDHYALVLVL